MKTEHVLYAIIGVGLWYFLNSQKKTGTPPTVLGAGIARADGIWYEIPNTPSSLTSAPIYHDPNGGGMWYGPQPMSEWSTV